MKTTFTISADEMRALEKAAVDSGNTTWAELMERAGQGVVEAIFETWPELDRGLDPDHWEYLPAGLRRATVLCGPGNNGGDGFVVARLLAARGWEVVVFFYGNRDKLGEAAGANYDRWAEGNEVIALGYPTVTDADLRRYTDESYGLSGTSLVIDAAFGIGLTRPIDGLREIFGYNDIEVGIGDRLTPAKHVAIDLPSGMYADRPSPLDYPSWFLADLTVTFDSLKRAHVEMETMPSCGQIVVKDIGL